MIIDIPISGYIGGCPGGCSVVSSYRKVAHAYNIFSGLFPANGGLVGSTFEGLLPCYYDIAGFEASQGFRNVRGSAGGPPISYTCNDNNLTTPDNSDSLAAANANGYGAPPWKNFQSAFMGGRIYSSPTMQDAADKVKTALSKIDLHAIDWDSRRTISTVSWLNSFDNPLDHIGASSAYEIPIAGDQTALADSGLSGYMYGGKFAFALPINSTRCYGVVFEKQYFPLSDCGPEPLQDYILASPQIARFQLRNRYTLIKKLDWDGTGWDGRENINGVDCWIYYSPAPSTYNRFVGIDLRSYFDC